MDETTAISRARRLLTQLETDSYPVDVLGIADAQGFEVRDSDQLGAGEAGSVIKKGDRKIIFLNKHDHPYRRRFTILHEVAHHLLELPSVHGGKLGSNELEHYRGRPPEEILCDVFAAECLVPWQLIQPLTDGLEFSATTISRLSDEFQASKPCVASRFAQTSREALAYVLVEDETIRHTILSKSLREKRVWIDVGIKVPKESAAAAAIHRGSEVEIAELDGSDWSNSDAAESFACHEEAIHSPDWSQTLSLLTFEEVVSAHAQTKDASREEDELLPELTGQLPWPKK